MNDVIYKSDNLIIREGTGFDRAPCVVTFAEYTPTPLPLDRSGFGEKFLKKAGHNAFHVICRGNDWYQYPEMPAAIAELKRRCAGYADVVTYGTSMGAYAAIRFAPHLQASRVIAISPQVSIDRRRVPFETRWAKEAAGITFDDDDILSALTSRTRRHAGRYCTR